MMLLQLQRTIFLLWTLTTPLCHVSSFNAVASRSNLSQLSMVKFNGEEWVAESTDETSEAGYPVINTLFRHGPKPFLTRIFQPNDYEQAVLKFMAGDKCDRRTAQGNMDQYVGVDVIIYERVSNDHLRYLANPNDWAFNRKEEEQRGVKYDYVTIKPKDVVLVLFWTSILAAYFGRALYAYIYGVDFVRDRLTKNGN